MGLKDDFKTFTENLRPTNIEDMEKTVGEIAKKLNKHYYSLIGDEKSNMYIVGSVGRTTAIKGVSDLDIIFNLPNDVYKKYNSYVSGGQSALLQEVKNVLKERYSNTDISGDGQVVVIKFNKYTVELVPGFKQSDDSFKYPDTHDGGKWKITNPLPEIKQSKTSANQTNGNFRYIANMLRSWKNKQGFKFGGLLIDTLSFNFLESNSNYSNIDFDNYLEMIKELFSYLKSFDKERSYWLALGSNQQVYNCDNGKFITKAKKCYDRLESLTESSPNINKELRKIFGSQFPKKQSTFNIKMFSENRSIADDTEQFIDELFPVDIRYDLELDCYIHQNGFRTKSLKNLLREKGLLRINKKLDFYICNCDIDFNKGDYKIYWKVRNKREEAVRKNCIRGQIRETNEQKHHEVSSFSGEHFVECYVIENGVCVAKGHIDVPISSNI